MAKVTSGSFNTTAFEGRYLNFAWTATQDVATNTSTISWTLKGVGGSGYHMAGAFKVVIDGETVYSSDTRIELWNGTLVASGTKKITHNTNGTRSFKASAQAGIYYVATNCTGEGTWELTDIARAATITAVTDFTDEGNPTLTYSNPAGNSATNLQAFFSVDGKTAATSLYTLSKTGTSHTFTLTDAERAALRPIEGGTSRVVYCHLRTTLGSTVLEKTKGVNITVVNGAPTITLSVVNDSGDNITTLTGANTIIRNHNKLITTVNLAARKGAYLTKYYVTGGNTRLSDDTPKLYEAEYDDILTNIEGGEIRASVVDSRNEMSAATPITYNFIEYVDLTCSLDTTLPTADGTITLKISGNYWSGNFGLTNNFLLLRYAYAASGETEIYNTVMPSAIAIDGANHTYSATVNITGLDYRKLYTFKAIASDKIAQVESAAISVKTKPVYDWGAEDFNLNVPLHYQGNRVPLIAEEGEADGWRYRKWDNGYCEAWKTVAVTTAISSAWGTMYVGNTKMARQNYPFPYDGKPIEQATLQSGSSAAWLFAESSGNGVNGGYSSAIYNVCRPSSVTTSSTYYISLYVYGKLLE